MNPKTEDTAGESQWHKDRKRAGQPSAESLEMANRGTHDKVMAMLAEARVPSNSRILDIGAGMGSLSRLLKESGYEPRACDLYPEEFLIPDVECRRVDANGTLPYDNASADVVLAVELVEHIDGHQTLFAEVQRVLAPGGLFLFTTPNILSLKSRMMFLFTGYPYSFPSLDPAVCDPVAQHITPFSLDRYLWRLKQSGLSVERVSVDKYQSTSRALGFLAPLIRFVSRTGARRSESLRLQNSRDLLYGRILLVLARKPMSVA